MFKKILLIGLMMITAAEPCLPAIVRSVSTLAPPSRTAVISNSASNASGLSTSGDTTGAIAQQCATDYVKVMDSRCKIPSNTNMGRCACNDLSIKYSAVEDDETNQKQQINLTGTLLQQLASSPDPAVVAQVVAQSQQPGGLESILSTLQHYVQSSSALNGAAAGGSTSPALAWGGFDDSLGKSALDAAAAKNSATFSDIAGDKTTQFKLGDELYTQAERDLGDLTLRGATCVGANQLYIKNAYASKIISDCWSYYTLLEQTNKTIIANQQKLMILASQISLTNYGNANKYTDVPSCVTAIDLCMKNANTCGNDLTKCISTTNLIFSSSTGQVVQVPDVAGAATLTFNQQLSKLRGELALVNGPTGFTTQTSQDYQALTNAIGQNFVPTMNLQKSAVQSLANTFFIACQPILSQCQQANFGTDPVTKGVNSKEKQLNLVWKSWITTSGFTAIINAYSTAISQLQAQ